MVLENDKTTEARRKAMRNGEEDPLVVAQRFLNIYRQMHIFSPERKEAFNKMLLELSPEIRGLFSSLPGGIMLQDYVDDLAEKNGVQKSVHSSAAPKLNEEAHQQAQILATALAQAQSQVQSQTQPRVETVSAPVAAVSGTANLTMDKDFAAEFAKIIGGVMEQQTLLQKENLEKLSENLTQTQLFIAQSLKETKGKNSEDIKGLCKVIVEVYKRAKEDQQSNMEELCKTIAKTQTAASSKEEIPVSKTVSQDEATQRLMEVVLDGQKQLSSRLSKVEELSLSRANDNKELLAVFEKSQTEMIKSFKEAQEKSPAVGSGNEERLAKLIGESQERLIHTILAANIQQSASSSQANNANNIHINAPDNSAQMLLLVDKIASLQAANEQNLEKALAKIVEAQGGVYDKISRRQTEELAQIITKGLNDAKKIIEEAPREEKPFLKEYIPEVPTVQAENIFAHEKDEPLSEDVPVIQEKAENEPRKKKKKKKKKKLEIFEQSPQEQEGVVEESPFDKEDFSINDLPDITELTENFSEKSPEIPDFQLPEEENIEQEELKEQDSMEPVENEPEAEVEEQFNQTEDFPIQEFQYPEENQEETDEGSKELNGDDWGFGASSAEPQKPAAVEDNDNGEGTDWTWDYVEDTAPEEADGEAIGENSYIYSGDLFGQEKVSNGGALMYGMTPERLSVRPKIITANDEDISDPYQNSILKD